MPAAARGRGRGGRRRESSPPLPGPIPRVPRIACAGFGVPGQARDAAATAAGRVSEPADEEPGGGSLQQREHHAIDAPRSPLADIMQQCRHPEHAVVGGGCHARPHTPPTSAAGRPAAAGPAIDPRWASVAGGPHPAAGAAPRGLKVCANCLHAIAKRQGETQRPIGPGQ